MLLGTEASQDDCEEEKVSDDATPTSKKLETTFHSGSINRGMTSGSAWENPESRRIQSGFFGQQDPLWSTDRITVGHENKSSSEGSAVHF